MNDNEYLNDLFQKGTKKDRENLLMDMFEGTDDLDISMLSSIDLDVESQYKIVDHFFLDPTQNYPSNIGLYHARYIKNMNQKVIRHAARKNHLTFLILHKKIKDDDTLTYCLEKYFQGDEIIAKPSKYINSTIIMRNEPFSDKAQELILQYNPSCLNFLSYISPNTIEKAKDAIEYRLGKHINFSSTRDINQYSENQICNILTQYPWIYFLIDNPTYNINRTLINVHPLYIGVIKDPCEDLQLESVSCLIPMSICPIKHIKNPYESVCRKAVNINPGNIIYIENPSEEIQLLCLENDWSTTMYNIIQDYGPHSKDFNHKLKKLKLKYGPMDCTL